MAEIVNNSEHTHYASNAKANAGLTLGTIGTSLAGLMFLQNGGLSNLFGTGTNNGLCAQNAGLTNEDLYLERKQCENFLDTTK